MAIRVVLFLMLMVSTSLGADGGRVWQIGRLASVHVASIDPYRPEDFQDTSQLVGPEQAGQPLPSPKSNPQFHHQLPHASIRFTIRSDTGIYVAEKTVLMVSEPYPPKSSWAIDPASIAPWVKDLPWLIKFRVKGKILYYLDAKGKERKARICNPSL